MPESTTEVYEKVYICGGTLTAWQRFEELEGYDQKPSRKPEFWTVFERNETSVEIRSAEELFRVLLQQGCDLASEVEPVASALVDIIAILMRVGRAITDPLLFDFLEARHKISLRDHLPRVENHLLLFLVGDFSEGTRRARLFDFQIDLLTGEIASNPRA